MANAQVKLVQGINTYDGVAADLVKDVACAITNSDGSGTSCKVLIKEMSGEGGSADEQSGTYSEGQVLVNGGPAASAAFTPDFYGGTTIEVIVDEGLISEKRHELVFWVPYPSHPAARIVNTPFNAPTSAVNVNAQTDGHAYALDGWAHALRLASLGAFRTDAVGTAATEGPSAVNETAAALGAQQYSPVMALGGKGWGTIGASSQDVRFGMQTRPIQGGVPTGELHFLSNIAGGGYTSRGKVDSAGKWTLPSLVAGGLTYPTADGTPNQVLKTDGSGVLSFTTVSGSGATWVNNATSISRGKFHVDGTLLVITDDGAGPDQVTLTAPGYVPTTRRIIAGTNVTITGGGGGSSDQLTADITINASAGAGGYSTIENVGSPETQRSTINLTAELVASDVSSKTQIALAGTLTSKTIKGLNVAPDAATGSVSAVLSVTPPNHTALTASTEFVHVNVPTSTWEWATGAISTLRFQRINAPTVAFVGASVVTNAYNLWVDAPRPGTNATLTNSFAAGFTRTSSTTNTVLDVTVVERLSSGTAAAGVGAGTLYRVQNGSGTSTASGRVSAVMSTVTASSEKGYVALAGLNGSGALANAAEVWGTQRVALGNVSGVEPVTGSAEPVTVFVKTSSSAATNHYPLYLDKTNTSGNADNRLIGFALSGTEYWRFKFDAGQQLCFESPGSSSFYLSFGGAFPFQIAADVAQRLASITQSSGTPKLFTGTGASHTGMTASAEVTQVDWNIAQTYTWATGAVSDQRFFRIRQPTVAFAGASTMSNAYTVYIDGPPVAGSNATISNPWALFVGGYTQITGQLLITSSSPFGGGISLQPSGLSGKAANLCRSIYTTTGGPTGITSGDGYATVYIDLFDTVQFATGSFANAFGMRLTQPTYSFVGASTITAAATLHIANAPAAGTNCTITDSYALWVDNGATRLDGDLHLFGLLTNKTAGNETGSATAGGGTLPATPRGFLSFKDSGGTTRKIAYYDA